MGVRITNIPKKLITLAVMGNTEYKLTNRIRAVDEPREKVKYYETSDRLTRAQILVFLELCRNVNSKGFGIEVFIRNISEATHLTMQCVNKSIKVLASKGFIVVPIKEYGYLNYYINIEQGYSKESNTGGYYPMDNDLLDVILNIKQIDELRLVLISLLEDDFAKVRQQKTFLAYESLRRIIPSNAHPKGRKKILEKKAETPYSFKEQADGIHFTLSNKHYGKYILQKSKADGEALLKKLKSKRFEISEEDEEDIISLCQEFGADSISDLLLSMDSSTMKSIPKIGSYIRFSMQAA